MAGEKTGALLEEKIASLLPANARWVLSIVDMKTGDETISIGNSVNKSMAPGSLMKLFVSGMALDDADRDGKIDMTTTICHDGAIIGDTLKGNIYMVGRGNPLLSVKDVMPALDRLSKAGIKRIVGDIVADNTLFDTKGFERTRKGPAYAPPGALGLDLHTLSVIVTPTEPGNAPAVSVEPPNKSVRFSVPARTVSGELSSIKIKQIDDVSYEVAGNIPEGSGGAKRRFPLDAPALYAAGTLKTLLQEAGIEVNGDAKRGKGPNDAKVIAVIYSPVLDDLIRDMNVNSLNVAADNLLLLLGEEKFGAPGTADKGIKAVEEFLGKADGVKIADGSGLEGRNKVTSGFMARYLYSVSKRPWSEGFKNSLPKGGKGRLREIGIEDTRFRVKTGMLEDVYALAGYGVDGKGREVAFSYIVNMPGADVLAVNKHGGEVIRMIAGLQ